MYPEIRFRHMDSLLLYVLHDANPIYFRNLCEYGEMNVKYTPIMSCAFTDKFTP